MTRSALLATVVLLLFVLAGAALPVRAQSVPPASATIAPSLSCVPSTVSDTSGDSFCTFSNPLGYQVQVPMDWQQVPIEGTDLLLKSVDGLQLTDIVVTDTPTDLNGIVAISHDVLRDYRSGINPLDLTVVEDSVPVSVANADAAAYTVINYTSRQQLDRSASLLIVTRGAKLYIFVLDTTRDYLASNHDQGSQILCSFALLP